MKKFKAYKSFIQYSLFVIICTCHFIGCEQRSEQPSHSESIVYEADTLFAIQDFEHLEVDGYVPAYRDEDRGAIAINSVEFPGEFGAVETVWRKRSGVYDITIETIPEEDGESTYRFIINGEVKGEFVNPETDSTFGYASHNWNGVEINPGDTIRVVSGTHSNNKIPENGGFAWARGRWSTLIFQFSN